MLDINPMFLWASYKKFHFDFTRPLPFFFAKEQMILIWQVVSDRRHTWHETNYFRILSRNVKQGREDRRKYREWSSLERIENISQTRTKFFLK